jgi:hypothetical protein
VNDHPLADPNHRDMKATYRDGGNDESPLSMSQRGETEPGRISMPKENEDSTTISMRLAKQVPKEMALIISVCNLLNVCVDMFMQRAGSMRSFVLKPEMQCTRNLSQFTSKPGEIVDLKAPLSILFSTVERVSIVVSHRHELRSFDFLPGPIGMEVEYKFSRLLCTKVLYGSQAMPHRDVLEGTEIVAVNGRRTTGLQEFQQAVWEAQAHGRITITAACYKRGKAKIDNFYVQLSTSRRKTNVKKLFGGLLASGVDRDHQHDVELPGSRTSDDDRDWTEDDATADSAPSRPRSRSQSPSAEATAKQSDSSPAASKEGVSSRGTQRSRGGGSRSGDSRDSDRKSAGLGGSDSEDSDTDNITSIRKNRSKAEARFRGDGRDDDREDQEGMIAGGRAQPKEWEEDNEADAKGADELFDETSVANGMGVEMISAQCDVVEEAGQDEELEEWDYATHLDMEEALPYSKLLCVPPMFQKSGFWGQPDNFVQFTNYSSRWDVQVCWVDEEGALVPRITLKAHGGVRKHTELTSTRHLWALIATVPTDPNAEVPAVEAGEEESTGPLVAQNRTPVVMLLRCSKASLQPRKYTSVIWTPWQNVAATQRMRPKEVPAHKRVNAKKSDDELQPDCLVQIMDGDPRLM